VDHFSELAKDLGPLPEHPTLSLDAGYDYRCVYDDLADRRITAKIARRGEQTPIQADGRWVVERTNSWLNNFAASSAGAPNAAGPVRSSSSAWPPPSSPSVAWFDAPGSFTAGTPALEARASVDLG
jgi:hypothetical protein